MFKTVADRLGRASEMQLQSLLDHLPIFWMVQGAYPLRSVLLLMNIVALL